MAVQRERRRDDAVSGAAGRAAPTRPALVWRAAGASMRAEARTAAADLRASRRALAPWLPLAARLAAGAGGVLAALAVALLAGGSLPAGAVLAALAALLLAAAAAGQAWLRWPIPEIRERRRVALWETRAALALHPLASLGVHAVHDRALPHGGRRVPHLLIGPGGVVVAAHIPGRGPLTVDAQGRLCQHGRPVAAAAALDPVARELRRVLRASIRPVLIAHGRGPLPARHAGPVVVRARQLRGYVAALDDARLDPDRVQWHLALAELQLPSPAARR
jgi:hypothetical protein